MNERQGWHRSSEVQPPYDREDDTHGTSVIVWHEGEAKQAFYGKRITNEPNFYLFGAVLDVEWWMPMPDAPGAKPAPAPWRVGKKQPYNVYDSQDRQIGCFFDPAFSHLAVRAVNAGHKIRLFLDNPRGLIVPEVLKDYIIALLDGTR